MGKTPNSEKHHEQERNLLCKKLPKPQRIILSSDPNDKNTLSKLFATHTIFLHSN